MTPSAPATSPVPSAPAQSAHPPSSPANGRSAFRGDIEGLRCLAVMLVVLWHAGLPHLKGGFIGVDVFFVVSGFLMTGILVRELERTGSIDFANFVRRRIRRLLPASLATLLVTAIGTLLIMPRGRWWPTGLDIAAAGAYVSNWRFAGAAIDYLAQDSHPSPVQHFWSLSVEEQYYLVWPVLLLALVQVFPVRGASARRLVLWVSLVVSALSLTWSIRYTYSAPGAAYFVTTTRIWELGLGGLVAVLAPLAAKVPGFLAASLSWAGLAAAALTGVFLPTTIPFPGWVALIPTLGTAAVIAFTPVDPRGPNKLLSFGPFRWVGSISYSMYLWHWPVLVLGTQALTRGASEAPLWQSLTLALGSALPAWLSLRFIENPARRSPRLAFPPTTWLVGVTAMTLAIVGGGALALRAGHPTAGPAVAYLPPEQLTPQSGSGNQTITVTKGFGADALGADPRTSSAGRPVDQAESITPDPARAAQDTGLANSSCHALRSDSSFHPCLVGEELGATKAMLVGDSHAGQWLPAVRLLARSQGWTLRMATKSACPLADVTVSTADGTDYVECREWNAAAMAALTGKDRPDIIFVSNSNYVDFAEGGTAGMSEGLASTYRVLREAGVKVQVLRDTPAAPFNVAECVDGNRDRLTSCDFPRGEALANRDQAQPEAVKAAGVKLVDLTDYVCPAEVCSPVIGGVLVWRDSNHMTDTYARTLAFRLSKALRLA